MATQSTKQCVLFLWLLHTSVLFVAKAASGQRPQLVAANQKLQPTPTPAATTTTVKVEIKCLNDDCNNSKDGSRRGSLISMNMITTSEGPFVSGDDDVITSVPRKEVVEEDVTSIPKKGVSDLRHSQSIKKEIKDQGSTASTAAAVAASTTTPFHPTSTPTRTMLEPAKLKPVVTTDEEDAMAAKTVSGNDATSSISLAVGLILALFLMAVLFFVGLKRLEALRRRREYRRMNDFLIDGMYNDL